MACLDTTMLVDLARGRSRFGERAVRKVHELLDRGETLVTTRLNVAELYVGVHLARDRDAELAKVRDLLPTLQIIEFDDRAAWLFAEATARLRRAGRPSGDMDVLIGAIASAAGHVLITRDRGHFLPGLPGLAVEDY
jgi:tRNA(fMet)-specific endonuclease VapC